MSKNPSDIIKALREKRGWTPEQAAGEIGISVFTLSLIERGTIQTPTMKTCVAIARAFDVPLQSVWSWAK